MRLRSRRFLAAVLCFVAAAPSAGASARELSTDRPDQTESPYSVEAGRIQAEIQAASAGRAAGADGWALQFASLNLKRGVTRSMDLQLVFPGVESGPEAFERASGIGDLTFRIKWNLRGNDRPGFALGVMPFVSAPTGGQGFGAGGWEAGLILPAALTLPYAVGLGVMAQADAMRDADGDGVHGEGFFTATVGRDLVGSLAGFAELALRARPAAEGKDPLALDLGLTYGAGVDTQVDGGVQIGLSDDAEDLRVFVGYTVRR